jgi:hypothetical protein
MLDQEAAQKIIAQNSGAEITTEMQDRLNQPLASSTELDPKDTEFLQLLNQKIAAKEIQLFTPSSLFNLAIYEKLGPSAQVKAEMDAYNMLASIREINRLWQAGHSVSYQLQNLVHKIRVTKERIEAEAGDIYII